MTVPYWKHTDETTTKAVSNEHPLPVDVMRPIPSEVRQGVNYETVTVADSVIGLTASVYGDAIRAFITPETAQIRFTYDGKTTPSTTVGHVLDPGVPLVIEGHDDIVKFRAIRTGASSGTLQVTYEKGVL